MLHLYNVIKAANQTNSNACIRENSWTGQDSFGLDEKTFEDDEIEERGAGSEDVKKKEGGGIEEGTRKKEEDRRTKENEEEKKMEEGGRREEARIREDEGRREIWKTYLSDRLNGGDVVMGKM